jgi:cell division transport system permease protein
MIRRQIDIPLERDAASRMLPWIIAIMVYLAALAIAGAITLSQVIRSWSVAGNGTLTIQVPFDRSADHTAAMARRAVRLLRATPGIGRARLLSRADVAALVKPWLGPVDQTDGLPLPALIDAGIKPGASVDLAALAKRLAARAPGTTVEDHQQWLDKLVGFARSIWLVTLLVMAMILLAAIVTVIFTTRTGLRIHHRVIEVLHLIGAHDRYISRQFERQAVLLSLKGALIGVLLAILTVVALAHLAAQVDLIGTPRLVFSLWQWCLFAAVPLVAGLVALYTARLTVLRTLGRLT